MEKKIKVRLKEKPKFKVRIKTLHKPAQSVELPTFNELIINYTMGKL